MPIIEDKPVDVYSFAWPYEKLVGRHFGRLRRLHFLAAFRRSVRLHQQYLSDLERAAPNPTGVTLDHLASALAG